MKNKKFRSGFSWDIASIMLRNFTHDSTKMRTIFFIYKLRVPAFFFVKRKKYSVTDG